MWRLPTVISGEMVTHYIMLHHKSEIENMNSDIQAKHWQCGRIPSFHSELRVMKIGC